VVESGAYMPAINGMGCQGAANGQFLVYEHVDARVSERCATVVKSTMELDIGRELGIDVGAMEEIQGD
jgi:hypothetical protein